MRQILEKTAQDQDDLIILTEDILAAFYLPKDSLFQRFSLMISPLCAVLLVGDSLNQAVNNCWEHHRSLKVGLSFERSIILDFLQQLESCFKNKSFRLKIKDLIAQIPDTNQAVLQAEINLSLMDVLVAYFQEEHFLENGFTSLAVCQPVEDALRQQVEQERLLNQVVSQMRQSLNLPTILRHSLEQIRPFMQVDRLLIYQVFRGENPAVFHPFQSHQIGSKIGSVTYEAKTAPSLVSVLEMQEKMGEVLNLENLPEDEDLDYIQVIDDIEVAYKFSPECLNYLRKVNVKSTLTIPIIITGQLWGFLIAQQCSHIRHWQENDQQFLKKISEHLAIAIYQAQLFAQIQQQKQTLEQRVAERTQDLYDALVAAQSANRAKSEFLSTMSHELRTPLTCVIGLSSTLLHWSFGQLSKRQRSYLQTIHDSGAHLLELINDILELSKVESGKAVLNINQFSLSRIAQQSLQNLAEKAQQKNVKLTLDVKMRRQNGKLKGDRFSADERRVRQILNNLLSNAVKFTPEEGNVILRVWREEDSALFQVEDTGIGIPEHQIPLLFQKFQQLDPSYHRSYEGTGLGLALTKQLVELHGGRVEVESTVGRGSIFTVSLPMATETILPKNELPIFDDPHGNIVLVEEQEEMATLICNILTTAGYQVVWLMEASTAIQQIELLQPDAVIANLRSPGINGCDLSETLRSSPTTEKIKILLLMSSEAAPALGNSCVDQSVDYLPIPINPEQLLHKVAALMKRSPGD